MMKKNQKLSSALGVNINELNDEIEYTKSEQYYSLLIKKLMNAPKEQDTEVEESDEHEKTSKDSTKK